MPRDVQDALAFGWSNGEPASSPDHTTFVSSPFSVAVCASPSAAVFASLEPSSSSGGRPHWRASGSNDPPSVSVADVRIAVRCSNRVVRNRPPTPIGATCNADGRFGRPSWTNGFSNHTTSKRSPISGWNASSIRTAVSCRSSSDDRAALRAAMSPGSESFFSGPSAVMQACAASRTTARVLPRADDRTSIRPCGRSSRRTPSPSAASFSRSATASSMSRPQRRAAVSTPAALKSP